MRIGVNTRVLLSTRMEGVCRYMHETLQRMVRQHPETEFVFFFDRPYDRTFIYGENVTPVVLSPPARHPFLWYLWFEWSLPRAMKKHNIDVLYSGDTYMSLSTEIPTILVCHDIAYHHYPDHIPFLCLKYYQKYFPRFHKKATKIIAVSQFTKEDITKVYNLDPEKIVVGHNSIKDGLRVFHEDEKITVREKYSDGSKYMIYLGAVHPRKNIDRVVKAFDKFKKESGSDIKLILVARVAWNASSFTAAMDNATHKADIIHLKELYNEEVNVLTASAECMIYVSLFEGFGLPILEAMACDVPVITSNVSSMPEVAGDAAILVDPTNIDEITTAMFRVMSDSKLREELISKSRIQREKFNWDKTAEITFKEIVAAAK